MNCHTPSRLLLFALLLLSSGCAHRRYLRPVAVVREQAAQGLSCDGPIEVRRLSASYEQRARVDAYEARGCGRRYTALCDAPRSTGGCSAVAGLPAQGVPPGQARSLVEVVGVHEGWAPAGADAMWERLDLNDEYARRLVSLSTPAPLRFAVTPGPQRVRVASGPSRVQNETRISTYDTTSTYTVGSTRYRETTTHFVPYQVAVRYDDAGCSSDLRFDALPGHEYQVGYLVQNGRCATVCRDITGGSVGPCVGSNAASW